MKKGFHKTRCILVTGLSGAGKKTALDILEDHGFFSIDKLPSPMVPALIQMIKKSDKGFLHVAFSVDTRDSDFLKAPQNILKLFKDAKIKIEIIFLMSDTKTLISRYSTNRRPHPLAKLGSIQKMVEVEKKSLHDLKEKSDAILDTSTMNVHQLKKVLINYLHTSDAQQPFKITLLSFGFKLGGPTEVDLLLDVRFIDNPYFVPKLKNKLGTTPSVRDFVLSRKEAKRFIAHITQLLNFIIPCYKKEGKANLTIAFGCTGGKHRSIVMAEYFGKLLSKKYKVQVIHRDWHKAS